MSPSVWINSSGPDSTGNPGARARPLGPVARVLIGIAALGLLVLGVLVAIPLLLVGAALVFIAIIVARVRSTVRRRERNAGRENVRVIRRDIR